MRKLPLSSWAEIAEIVGAVAVVLSLIYVGLEIRQNTAAVKASNHQALIEYGRSQAQILLENPELAAIISQGETGLSTLTSTERERFFLYTTWLMSNWEATYLSWKNNLLDDKVWEGYDAYFSVLSQKPGYSEFFIESKPQWEQTFYEDLTIKVLVAK